MSHFDNNVLVIFHKQKQNEIAILVTNLLDFFIKIFEYDAIVYNWWWNTKVRLSGNVKNGYIAFCPQTLHIKNFFSKFYRTEFLNEVVYNFFSKFYMPTTGILNKIL